MIDFYIDSFNYGMNRNNGEISLIYQMLSDSIEKFTQKNNYFHLLGKYDSYYFLIYQQLVISRVQNEFFFY